MAIAIRFNTIGHSHSVTVHLHLTTDLQLSFEILRLKWAPLCKIGTTKCANIVSPQSLNNKKWSPLIELRIYRKDHKLKMGPLV